MVMDSSPSRQKGERLPVDAVTFNEAKRFCERLSWLCGEPIRLPSVEDVQWLLTSHQESEVKAAAWFAAKAKGKTQLVATSGPLGAGIYDLLGNVEEWVTHAEESAVVLGSVMEDFGGFWPVRIENKSPLERNRFRGFRFVYGEAKE